MARIFTTSSSIPDDAPVVKAILIISVDIYCRNNQTVELLNQAATKKPIFLNLSQVKMFADLMFIAKVRKEGFKFPEAIN